MRASAFLLLLAIILFQCRNEEEEMEEKTSEAFDEVPAAIIPSKPCTTLYQGIMEMFMESRRNNDLHNILFASGAEKNIVLTQESEVYITFISEGAGWANALGYYTYNISDPPDADSELEKIILFPHVSDQVLNQGDMLQIGQGKFPAGTVIGFCLITRGWENGSVNYARPTIYTDINLNRNNYQQHVLFKEGECGDIVLGLEDRFQDQQDCDFDYNDVIFTIADNKNSLETVNFDLDAMVILTPP
jgi:hypothetical protein